jgi:hypothetical protein
MNVTVLVDDQLHPDGPLPRGTNLGWSPFLLARPDAEPTRLEGVVFAGVGLASVDRGSHLEANLPFTPSEPGTYYAVIEVAPPNQAYEYQLVSTSVDPAPAQAKGSPGLPAVLMFAAVAVALALRRRI